VRPSRFTQEQIIGALRQVKFGTPAVDVCRKLGITETTFYRWRNKHDEMHGTNIGEVRALRDENQRLRQIVANLLLDQQRTMETRIRK
jgi:putative transposase